MHVPLVSKQFVMTCLIFEIVFLSGFYTNPTKFLVLLHSFVDFQKNDFLFIEDFSQMRLVPRTNVFLMKTNKYILF